LSPETLLHRSGADFRSEQRAEAVALYRAAVKAADPRRLVHRALAEEAPALARARRIVLVAVGKAGLAMAEAARPHVAHRLRHALVVTTAQAARPLDWARVIAGGHPLPDEGSLQGGAALVDALGGLRDDDLVLLLVSGGGSALLAAPPPGVSLEDKVRLANALLRSGADIGEMNAVRAAVSALKGGGLARLAMPAPVLALLLSDVPDDDIGVIASGLSAPVSPDPARALEVLRQYRLLDAAPRSVLAHLGDALRAPRPLPNPRVRNRVIGSNSMSVDAVEALLRRSGRRVLRVPGWLEGDVGEAAGRLVTHMHEAAASAEPAAVVAGGETSVSVRGSGQGGRNQELALRVALLAERAPIGMPWVFLSGGTDGRDGPTDAAGGLVDPFSLLRMRQAGLDPEASLAENDSHPALRASGDLLPLETTDTNVADVQIALLG
jgi:hydroxypyruvate reductase